MAGAWGAAVVGEGGALGRSKAPFLWGTRAGFAASGALGAAFGGFAGAAFAGAGFATGGDAFFGGLAFGALMAAGVGFRAGAARRRVGAVFTALGADFFACFLDIQKGSRRVGTGRPNLSR